MLDSDTKRRIDTARDILVGKVPDPKSQVDQITIALIYKFMDDIDAQSEEWGGDRTFFAGEFSRYGWAKLMSPGLGGHERLNLYAESISRMGENPGVPPLFRAIFDNAFLPYRDPETLTAFLKIIDQFNYDHSERLGDSFEYLLQVMGAQGDAGQFRTPRHIIDFIVRIVDPQKHETILDPACGTAGFLISAYKHIRAANIDEHGILTLTPDDFKRLFANITGYDISPDMVRLSLANMYLHGFPDPHVHEYDTLTSEERWNERADVILANPPFMSPKGGIRPHNRFGVQSKRSEVLFVDYIAEHLTPGGRAGVIVPEGVIFQSQRAYTQLRKMLIEEYLAAVVSLPAGVFNPYSGVKTSILLLDTAIARNTDRIAFFKVENDGFDLGAQRRPIINANDLPSVEAELTAYLRAARAGEPMDDAHLEHCMIVDKQRIAADGEHNLSAERYRESEVHSLEWPMASLGDVVDIESGSRQKGGAIASGIPSIGGEQIHENGSIRFDKMKYVSHEHFQSMKKGVLRNGDVLVVKDGATTGKTGFFSHDMPASVNEHVFIFRAKESIHPYYLYLVVRSDAFQDNLRPYIKGIIGGISLEIRNIKIPLPPLAVQREIVEEVDGYQRVIEGARAVVESWRPRVRVDLGWEVVEIKEACIVNPRKAELAELDGTTIVSFLPMSDMSENEMYFEAKDSKYLRDVGSGYTYFRDGDVLVAKVTPCFENGKGGIAKCLINGIGFGSSEFHVLRPTALVIPQWIYLCVATPEFRAYATPKMTGTGGLQRVPRAVVENYRIPLPTLDEQRAIVEEVESEGKLVAASRELAARMEGRIWSVLARVLP